MKHRIVHYERRRVYPIPIGDAWEILANTDHLNRSIGLPAITFAPQDGATGRMVREARARAFGVVPLRWREFPFDWIRDRRYVVRREFEWGPVAVLEGGVELEPEGEGTNVTVFADFTPANVFGRVLWRMGAGVVSDTLDYCDKYLTRRAAGVRDPLPVPRSRPHVDDQHLDRLIERLRSAPVPAELLPLLRERITDGDDDQVLGIRSNALADSWGADRFDVLRLLLHATKAGLFELRWELMCPNCRIPKQETGVLAEVPVSFHCDTCGIDYATDFDQRVELRFSVHESVRRAHDAVYCIGGPFRMPHVLAQQYLSPHESRTLNLKLEEPVRLRTVGGRNPLTLLPSAKARPASSLSVIYADGHWSGPHSMQTGDILAVPGDASLQLRNQTGGPLLVVVEDVEWTGEATTAAQVTALQEFRDLFSSEVLAPGQQLSVKDIALLFSDLKGSTSLYEGVGDASAYGRVNRHFDFVKERVSRHHGTVVKTMGDGVMAGFATLDDALAAAISMQREIGEWCSAQGIDPALKLKIGVHHGPAIAMTANDRLDYFGRTVNLAARLGEAARGGDVVLVEDVYEEARSSAVPNVERFTAEMRGIDRELSLVRLCVV